MNALIIEDEILASQHLQQVLDEVGDISVIMALESITETIEWFSKNPQSMIVLLLCFHRNGIGQEAIKIKRITSSVEFDVIPREAAWQILDLFALTMHKPNYGTQSSEKSEVRIGYDNEFLWISASLYMKDASKIFAVTKKRDKALYMFSTKLSATVLFQYVNTEDDLITNSRLRYNPSEGNDFYLVLNDFRGISDRYFIPERPTFFNRTLMVKYTHTFIL